MLVPFAIDADSLAPDPSWTPSQLRAYHLSLLGVWCRFGLLVHDGAAFETSRLRHAVEALPQKLRPLWMEVLKHTPIRPCGNGWDGSIAAGNVDLLSETVAVALVDDVRAEVEFGLAEDELSKPVGAAGGIEICRLIAAAQAKAFATALERSMSHIEKGQTFSEVWSERFRELAGAPIIKYVSIVDRYAVSRHFKCPQTQLSGLERFLRLLDLDASGPRYVTLYSAWTKDLCQNNLADVEAELRFVMGRLPAKKVGRLIIFMIPNHDFGVRKHDRFLRFGDYVWDIGHGLKVFEGAFAGEQSSAAFKTGAPVAEYKQAELDLAHHQQAKKLEIKLGTMPGSTARWGKHGEPQQRSE